MRQLGETAGISGVVFLAPFWFREDGRVDPRSRTFRPPFDDILPMPEYDEPEHDAKYSVSGLVSWVYFSLVGAVLA